MYSLVAVFGVAAILFVWALVDLYVQTAKWEKKQKDNKNKQTM